MQSSKLLIPAPTMEKLDFLKEKDMKKMEIQLIMNRLLYLKKEYLNGDSYEAVDAHNEAIEAVEEMIIDEFGVDGMKYLDFIARGKEPEVVIGLDEEGLKIAKQINDSINMSTFKRTTKHPLTGKWEDATWHDDMFGSHVYGVQFKDKSIFNENEIDLETRHCESCKCE